MDVVRVNDSDFRPFISHAMIQQRIKEIAAQINHDLAKEKPLFIGILNGSFMFAADLLRELSIKSEITFVKLSSYDGTQSTGEVITRIGLMPKKANGVIVKTLLIPAKRYEMSAAEGGKAIRMFIAPPFTETRCPPT
jgi:hypoxanthine phosphoribosyltransferase